VSGLPISLAECIAYYASVSLVRKGARPVSGEMSARRTNARPLFQPTASRAGGWAQLSGKRRQQRRQRLQARPTMQSDALPRGQLSPAPDYNGGGPKGKGWWRREGQTDSLLGNDRFASS